MSSDAESTRPLEGDVLPPRKKVGGFLTMRKGDARRGGRQVGTKNYGGIHESRVMFGKDLAAAHKMVHKILHPTKRMKVQPSLQLQFQAACVVFDRYYGRVRAQEEGVSGFDYSTLSTEQIEALTTIAAALREAQQRGIDPDDPDGEERGPGDSSISGDNESTPAGDGDTPPDDDGGDGPVTE